MSDRSPVGEAFAAALEVLYLDAQLRGVLKVDEFGKDGWRHTIDLARGIGPQYYMMLIAETEGLDGAQVKSIMMLLGYEADPDDPVALPLLNPER